MGLSVLASGRFPSSCGLFHNVESRCTANSGTRWRTNDMLRISNVTWGFR